MTSPDVTIAVFSDHLAAENAVKILSANGFQMNAISVVGKGYHTEEKVVGFYNTGDRVKFWGLRGAFWGGLWALFLGGLLLTLPVTGPVMVLGGLAATAVAVVENAIVVGGLSALGAALYSLGLPKDSVIEYEAAVIADNFLVMAHGSPEDIARARALLASLEPTHLTVHVGVTAAQPSPLLPAET
ncbi:general stress protein [Pararhodospirillum photometricum]|uniref:General stress protein 17M-like domain-containing protein n=1 Tax=Pararhodospirillum photometricum DSM 122 TaxID=1150469 RepID=H6SPU3_PARPM|nr:hypothetical protein [Pararhodospirillum photometricum]CCG07213.1 Putative uncharacterized protein [Pararhodospirillum photometricum DSM 122]